MKNIIYVEKKEIQQIQKRHKDINKQINNFDLKSLKINSKNEDFDIQFVDGINKNL